MQIIYFHKTTLLVITYWARDACAQIQIFELPNSTYPKQVDFLNNVPAGWEVSESSRDAFHTIRFWDLPFRVPARFRILYLFLPQ